MRVGKGGMLNDLDRVSLRSIGPECQRHASDAFTIGRETILVEYDCDAAHGEVSA
jgi:hypothetical protein